MKRKTSQKHKRHKHRATLRKTSNQHIQRHTQHKTTRIQKATPPATQTNHALTLLHQYYELGHIKKHKPVWRYEMAPDTPCPQWLHSIQLKPLSREYENSLACKLKQMLHRHIGDIRVQPQLTPTFRVAELLHKHSLIQHRPFLHYNREIEYWKLYGGSFAEHMHVSTRSPISSSTPPTDTRLFLRYRYIANVPPNRVMQKISQVWKNVNLSSLDQPHDERVDILMDMHPDARTESGTIEGQDNHFHIINLQEDIHVLHSQIKERYTFYNAINRNRKFDASSVGGTASKISILSHISVAHQVLRENGVLFLDMNIGSLFSLHTLILLRMMFKCVVIFRSYIHPPTKTECCVKCEGFVGYTTSLHERLQTCIEQLQNVHDSSLDVGFLNCPNASCASLYENIHKMNGLQTKYAFDYVRSLLQCSEQFVDKASAFMRSIISKQHEVARQIVQDVYKIPLPHHMHHSSLHSLTSPSDNNAHICLVNIPGSGMQAIIDMLFSKCHKAQSSKQKMVFIAKNNKRRCIIETYPYTTASEYDESALKMVLCCHPYERASRALALIQHAKPHTYEFQLAKLFQKNHIEQLSDLFVQGTEQYAELIQNKIVCPQKDYITSTFQLPICTNTEVYNTQASILRNLERVLQMELPQVPQDKHSQMTVHAPHALRHHIERIYHDDYLFLRFPLTSNSTKHRVIHLFSAHIPYHPSDDRVKKTRVHRYCNLKHAPKGYLLPPLAEKVYNVSPDATATKVNARVYYFVHIAKTGGVSIKHALRDRANPLNSMIDPPQNLLLPGSQHHSYTRVLSRGHLRARDIDPRIRTFAVLREPLSRVQSAFQFIREKGAHSEVWGKNNFTIQELHRVFLQNRIHSVSDIFTRVDRTVRNRILNHEHFRCMWESVCDPHGKVITDHLFVLETMQAHALSSHLNIQPIQLPHKNASQNKYVLTPEDKQHIRNHYARDIALYDAVVKSESGNRGRGVAKQTLHTSFV